MNDSAETVKLDYRGLRFVRGGRRRGVAHSVDSSRPEKTKCGLAMENMQQVLDGVQATSCSRCASRVDLADVDAFFRATPDASAHAVVPESDWWSLSPYASEIARVTKPGGHFLCSRKVAGPTGDVVDLGVSQWFDYRGQILRVLSTADGRRADERPAAEESEKKKRKRRNDLARRSEVFLLFRRRYEGTVGDCLLEHGTGQLRALPSGEPFSDVIHEDDRRRFFERVRRAVLFFGVGVILDPFKLRRTEVTEVAP